MINPFQFPDDEVCVMAHVLPFWYFAVYFTVYLGIKDRITKFIAVNIHFEVHKKMKKNVMVQTLNFLSLPVAGFPLQLAASWLILQKECCLNFFVNSNNPLLITAHQQLMINYLIFMQEYSRLKIKNLKIHKNYFCQKLRRTPTEGSKILIFSHAAKKKINLPHVCRDIKKIQTTLQSSFNCLDALAIIWILPKKEL